MAYTKFGEFMRVQRIKRHERIVDVAKILGVSAAFLSLVERGKRNVPGYCMDVISNYYNLSDSEQGLLYDAVCESKTHIKIDLTSATPLKRKAAVKFVTAFESMDDETAKEIAKILKNV